MFFFFISEKEFVCSCPPFECTCSRWSHQTSPRIASSPPFAKRLNFYGPAHCDIPATSGMQSLSIEIDTNKPLNYTNTYPYMQNELQQSRYQNSYFNSAQYLPPYSNYSCGNSGSCGDFKQNDSYSFSSKDFFNSSDLSSRRSCENTSFPVFKSSRRHRSTADLSSNFVFCEDAPHSVESIKHIIKPEIKTDIHDGHQGPNRSCSVSKEQQNMQTASAPFEDAGEPLFDDNLDMIGSAFDTDIYTPLLQRFNENISNAAERQTAQIASATNNSSGGSITQLAELKSVKQSESRQRSGLDTFHGATPKCLENQFMKSFDQMQVVSESLHYGNTNYFPLPSYGGTQETSMAQARNYDIDSRYPHQQLTPNSAYCNHSINITLRYK